MKQLLKNIIFKYLLCTVLFGAVYSLLSFVLKGVVDIDTLLRAMGAYFIVMCLFYFITPKLRKITGQDKDNN